MSEPMPVWNITPEAVEEAEQMQRNEALGELGEVWGDFAEQLSVVYTELRARLPRKLSRAVTLMYASHVLMPRAGACDCDEDA